MRLIIIESRSKQRFIPDQIGNTLVCELRLIVFFVNIMFIFFLCQWNYMSLTFPGLGHHYCYIPIPIHMQREALTNVLYVAIRGMLTPGFISVSASLWSEITSD